MEKNCRLCKNQETAFCNVTIPLNLNVLFADMSIDVKPPGHKESFGTVYDVSLSRRGQGNGNHFNIQNQKCSTCCVLV